MLAKKPAFAALYNHLQLSTTQDGEPCVRKYYRALSQRPPPLGTLCYNKEGAEAARIRWQHVERR